VVDPEQVAALGVAVQGLSSAVTAAAASMANGGQLVLSAVPRANVANIANVATPVGIVANRPAIATPTAAATLKAR